jgi:hypothetical protein
MAKTKNNSCNHEEDEKLRKEAKSLIDSIIISDDKEKEQLKKIFDDLENGELKKLFENLKKTLGENKERISKI